ncbi:MAG TPA: hypothetical protein VMW50_02510 [Dehalococcoidia bacterium]|jgi:hypothetical protein|nr:hypothetical protein [Dehalococcoidia bacterium]
MAKRISNNDAKLSDANRHSRESQDRKVKEDRNLTDEERLDEFRFTSFQSALPDIPPIDGYHVCWLTTENPRDPIHGRMRLGYEPVKSDDIPGWEHASLKTGEWAGCIGINEMVAFKLPLRLYEAYMKEAHHTQPLMEENKLDEARRMAEEGASQMARKPISFEAFEGQAELGQTPDAPSFQETLTSTRRG